MKKLLLLIAGLLAIISCPACTNEEAETEIDNPGTLGTLGIPAEFHAYDGLPHGFGLGTGTVAEGWIDDAVRFWERQMKATSGISATKIRGDKATGIYSINGVKLKKTQRGTEHHKREKDNYRCPLKINCYSISTGSVLVALSERTVPTKKPSQVLADSERQYNGLVYH